MRYLLNLAYLAVLLVSSPYWLIKSVTTGKYRESLRRRWFGVAPVLHSSSSTVWFHAVSVGEVLLLKPLIQRMKRDRPDVTVALSTSTQTGYALALEKYPDDSVFYAPLDFTWAVRRVFDSLRPSLLVLAELELWPNMLLEARSRGIPVAVVNARMSQKSFRGYFRIRKLLRPILEAVEYWGVQNELYAERIEELIGDNRHQVELTGSIKYEGAPTDRDNEKTQRLRSILGLGEGEQVIVAGSTQSPEEVFALDAVELLLSEFKDARLVLVPRHQERFEEVAQLLSRRNVPMVRRSEIPTNHEEYWRNRAERMGKGDQSGEKSWDEDGAWNPAKPVILVDTIGELSAIWGLADIGFVGGSFDGKRGGQSMIEPAGYGVPVCFGPHIWNFQDTVDRLVQIRGAVLLRHPAELMPQFRGWLHHPVEAAKIGSNARSFILSQQGAVAATLRSLSRLMPPVTPARMSA